MEEQTLEQTSTNSKGSSSLSIRGVLEVFYKPMDFFKELKDNPKILVPYVVFILIVFVSLFLLSELIVEMQVNSPQFLRQMEASGQVVTPEFKEIMKMNTLIFGTLAMALYPLLVAAFALFFGNFVFAGKGSFKKLLSVALYGGILFSLAGMIVIPMMLSKGSMMVSFSLAVLVTDFGIESIIYTALSKISIFHIWEIIVVGIGFATIYDFPRNKGYMLAVLSVGLISIIHIGMAALGSMIG